jgi:hypothetical protein
MLRVNLFIIFHEIFSRNVVKLCRKLCHKNVTRGKRLMINITREN